MVQQEEVSHRIGVCLSMDLFCDSTYGGFIWFVNVRRVIFFIHGQRRQQGSKKDGTGVPVDVLRERQTERQREEFQWKPKWLLFSFFE